MSMSDSTSIDQSSNMMDIPSSDIIRVILAHLTECGLHQTCQTLRDESGVGMAGIFATSKGLLLSSAEEGRWGQVLEILDSVDIERYRKYYIEDRNKSYSERLEASNKGNYGKMITPLEKAIALVHEITILELADLGEVELAYAALRLCSDLLDRTLPSSNDNDMDFEDAGQSDDHYTSETNSINALGMITSRSGDIERRITALSSLRISSAVADAASTALLLPANYYGPNNQSQQKRRSQITKLLKHLLPVVPMQRLSSLLQQSLKWQCHIGVFPTVRILFREKSDGQENNIDNSEEKGKKSKSKKQSYEQRFDLVLGNVDIMGSHSKAKRKNPYGRDGSVMEIIPTRPYQTIRLGKNSYVETALFLPDGKALITGSSDGFIEIWGEPIRSSDKNHSHESVQKAIEFNSALQTDIDFEKLRTSDLTYQCNDELMMHDSSILAMDVSHDGSLLGTTSADGTVCVWKIMDGKLLRKLKRAHGGSGVGNDTGCSVSCIQFSPDGSKILTGGHDMTCREFGLLATQMLKEFRGHQSYVNCCKYVVFPHPAAVFGTKNQETTDRHGSGNFLAVVTASADGTVRIWDQKTADPVREIMPPSYNSSTTALSNIEAIVATKSIHTVLHLHSPPHTMIVLPRSDQAYLMSYSGVVLKVFSRDDVQGTEFLTASINSSNTWLFVVADDGKCIVFDVNTGKVEKIIKSFGEECSGRSEGFADVTGIIHHPHRGLIGGYSNDKAQKRGILTLWK